jgi:hypothetical protein
VSGPGSYPPSIVPVSPPSHQSTIMVQRATATSADSVTSTDMACFSSITSYGNLQISRAPGTRDIVSNNRTTASCGRHSPSPQSPLRDGKSRAPSKIQHPGSAKAHSSTPKRLIKLQFWRIHILRLRRSSRKSLVHELDKDAIVVSSTFSISLDGDCGTRFRQTASRSTKASFIT